MVKLVLIAEFPDANTVNQADETLDRFRELASPNQEGILLYQATYEDVREFGLTEPDNPVRLAYVRPIVDDTA